MSAPRLHFVLGKGGVGRTTTSGALAMSLRKGLGPSGGAVLVVEVDELSTEAGGGDAPGNFPAMLRAFGHNDPRVASGQADPHEAATPRLVAPGVYVARLTASLGHEAFLKHSMPGGGLLTGALRSKPIRRFLEAAPAFHEMGQMAHLGALMGAFEKPGTARRFAQVVVDLPATGHALALADVPDAARKIIPVGPVARALGQAAAVMRDPLRSQVWVVTLPETLPISETLELLSALRAHGHPHPRVLLNRWPSDPFSVDGTGAPTADAAGTRAAAQRLVARNPKVRGARALRALDEALEATTRLPQGLEIAHLPSRPDLSGLALLDALALPLTAALAEGATR